MPPPPKDPALRQRTNRKETAALLDLEPRDAPIPRLMNRPERESIPDAAGKPQLDDHGKPRTRARPWLPISRAYWRALWTSPMAARWLPAFVFGLRRYLMLCDDFERSPSATLASEIRLQQALYGVDNLGLARLQWGFAPATKKAAPPAETPSPQAPAEDPRKLLRMVAK